MGEGSVLNGTPQGGPRVVASGESGLFGKSVGAAVQKAAVLSADGHYRYTLERYWGPGDRWALFIMLNPSTADADVDDPTIRRSVSFARREGCAGLLVWNLYALRATDPAELDQATEPIGHENEDHLWRMLLDDPPPALIIAAWGSKPNRGRYVNRELAIRVGPLYDREVHCLGLTRDGHPRHPLYVRGDAPLIPFNLRDEEESPQPHHKAPLAGALNTDPRPTPLAGAHSPKPEES